MIRSNFALGFVLGAALFLGSMPAASAAEVDLGLLVGWSTTDWDFEIPGIEDDIIDGKNGFQVGAFVAAPLGEILSVRGEVLYTRKGGKIFTTFVNDIGMILGEFDTFYNVEYLQIPVLLTVIVGEGETIRPVVFAGPYIGFELNAELQTEDIGDPSVTDQSEWELPVTESTDFGLVLGGGFELRAGEQVLLFHARYDLGLTEVVGTSKNEAWSIMAGIGF